MNLKQLARVTEKEGKNLALKVKRGTVTITQVKWLHETYPHDMEPIIALDYLKKWGIDA